MFRIFAKGIIYFLTVLLVLVVVFMGTALLRTYREYRAYKVKEVVLTVQLEKKQAELRARQEYLRMVLDDPDFIDRVIREKLGFSKPSEKVYRFGK
jgi:cell division protein DivIC